VITYVCFYADRAERRPIQALMMGAVATMVVSGLLLVWFLDHPYEGGSGSVGPTAMARTLSSMERARAALGARSAIPCDARGISP
jgi:hypothetical protein